MKRSRLLRYLTTTAALAALAPAAAAAQGLPDLLVQKPQIGSPERGSVVGSLSKLSFGPADVLRGAFSLPAPMSLPSDRGSALVKLLPSYSPEGGIGAWGMGWDTSLAITRHRIAGEITFDSSDDFTSPWGRLRQGSDGAWYPSGLQSKVRVEETAGGDFEATLEDGTVMTFDQRVTTDHGTYAWYLTRARTPLGDQTALSYAVNASGRPFLAEATYGGRGFTDAHRVRFVHESVPEAFVNYRSGAPLSLDRRVKQVIVESRHAETSAYTLRFSYDLEYQQSPLGPAFFLERVTKRYASGASEPPVVYAYDTGEAQLDAGTFEHLPDLDGYLSAVGASGIQPNKASYMDLDNDGVTDLEHNYAFTAVHHTDAGWTYEALGQPPAGAFAGCRPADSTTNAPRRLVRTLPDAAEPHVLYTQYSSGTGDSVVAVCDRAGQVLYAGQHDGDWSPDHDTRLVDLNMDRKPDMIRFFAGGYRILENVSDESAIEFDARDAVAVTPALSTGGFWVHDLNGDGVTDPIARGTNELVVWYGRGGFVYGNEPAAPGGPREGEVVRLWVDDQYYLTNLPAYHLVFLDANKDGLTDAAATTSGQTFLFLNQGSSFRYHAVPGLAAASTAMSYPVIADLSGRGDEEVVRTLGTQAHALALSGPSTGLLTRADDGKGNVIEFAYDRAPAVPGIGQRPSVLSEMTLHTSGDEPVTYTYDYESPVTHGAGRFLVGFGLTRKSSPLLTEEVLFHNDDDVSGVVLSTSAVDPIRAPGLSHFSELEYTDELLHGVPFKRLSHETKGARDGAGGEVSRSVAYEIYERDVCPTRTVTTNARGALVRETTLTDPSALDPAFAGAMHCIAARERVTGTHTDSSLDFLSEQSATRNALGQMTAVHAHDGASSLLLQQVTYDGLHRVSAVSLPGQGTTAVTYDPNTGGIQQISSPEGVVTTVDQRDPVSDLPEALRTDRGPGGVFTGSFRFDGFERLSKSWKSFGGSSEALPLRELRYDFPQSSPWGSTYDEPGVVRTWSLKNADAGTYSLTADFIAADGSDLTSASYTPDGWTFSAISVTDRGILRRRGLRRTPFSQESDPTEWTYGQILSGAVELSRSEASGLGHAVSAESAVQVDVTKTARHTVALSGGVLVSTTVENGQHTTLAARDADGLTVWSRDEAGNDVVNRHDALGRIVGITLADGSTHTLRYDGFGRPAEVDRPGIGAVSYHYDAVTGQLASKQYLDKDGALVRTVSIERDGVGRPSAEQHTLSGGGSRRFELDYDGDVGSTPGAIAGQRGFLTRVNGDDFTRVDEHDPDGALRQTTLDVGGWLRFETALVRHADGAVKSTSQVVRRLDSGAVVEDYTEEQILDAYGRLYQLRVNSAVLATLTYDGEGQLDRVDLAGGETIQYSYDPTTRRLNGYAQGPAASASGATWQLDARGLVAEEDFTIAGAPVHRAYQYDARGFLTGATDGVQTSSYTYTTAGALDTIDDLRGARGVHRGSASSITLGGVTYTYDALGRVLQKGDLALEYGPDGQIARATRGSDTWTYAYDNTGNRLLKRHNGAPVAAYVGSVYATDCHVVRPVHIGGRLVGLIEDGVFRLLSTDPRGTRLSDTDGTMRLPTPYGVRDARPDLDEAVDYAEKGLDPDLGVVRMGVRDYDPVLGQFWTPDPLFLESLDKCAESPVECNLYGYARNNPVTFVDPAGLESVIGQVLKASGIDKLVINYAKSQVKWRVTNAWNRLANGESHAWQKARELSLTPHETMAITRRVHDRIRGTIQARGASRLDQGGQLTLEAEAAIGEYGRTLAKLEVKYAKLQNRRARLQAALAAPLPLSPMDRLNAEMNKMGRIEPELKGNHSETTRTLSKIYETQNDLAGVVDDTLAWCMPGQCTEYETRSSAPLKGADVSDTVRSERDGRKTE